MRKVTIGIGILFSLLASAIGSTAYGLGETLVISAVQVRDASSSTNESVTLTNNTSGDIDVTNWCLQYASSSTTVLSESDISWRNLACAVSADEKTHIMLPAHQSMTAVSIESGWEGDFYFSATLANTSGHVRLINADNQEIDRVAWGEARFPETQAVLSPSAGQMLQRLYDETAQSFTDTGNNVADFIMVEGIVPPYSKSLYEAEDVCQNIDGFQQTLPVDHVITEDGQCLLYQDNCPNIEGVQLFLPYGFVQDDLGNCIVDSCLNIDGLQSTIPDGMNVDVLGYCYYPDICPNLPDLQIDVPSGYVVRDDGSCFLDILPIEISEVLANAKGSDVGNEFVELYNPNSVPVWLNNYRLLVGKNYETAVSFSEGLQIAAGGYLVISNADYVFTLLNTTTHVMIASVDGQVIYDMPAYSNPADDIAWANVKGSWQWTNRPTPGQKNLAWYEDVSTDRPNLSITALSPCAPNQYRNPATNRCKLIVASTSNLAACKEGQYRNPATNRCKSTESTTTLSACPKGQERNPDTNRCRNIRFERIPDVDHAVLGSTDRGASTSYLILGILALVVIGGSYAVWEWRRDIAKVLKKVWKFAHRSK